MGCGSSQVSNDVATASNQPGISTVNNNSIKPAPLPSYKFNNSEIEFSQPVFPKPPVAFGVSLDENRAFDFTAKLPPKRQLEPLNFPKLTAEMLAERQREADVKREKILKKRIATSKRSSQRRRDEAEIKQVDEEIINKHRTKIEDQQKNAEEVRLSLQKSTRQKQHKREEHAIVVRERAKSLKDGLDNELLSADLIEVDKSYNEDNEGDWNARTPGQSIAEIGPHKSHVDVDNPHHQNELDDLSRMRFKSKSSNIISFDNYEKNIIQGDNDQFFDT